ncbi:hypothetical protein [Microbulbifer sp. SAOS-129_SWC]|uniref:hypothetical protein n=1 Tax=Microbulbifer sp. SAOS-129_SWC TaxID=3145235 RepID=UPI0032170F0F
MNRLTQVQKLIKLADIQMIGLSEDLAKEKARLADLREELKGIDREIHNFEGLYRELLHGEMTLFNLDRISDVKMSIEYAEKRKAGLDSQVFISEKEVEFLVDEIHRCYTINENYEALAEELNRAVRKRTTRRLESRYDELSLVRWCRNEDR